jgi:TIR domain-containing protein
MGPVFLSYSNPDRPRAQQIAHHLKLAGFGLWWDAELSGADSFDEVIRQKVDEARAIVVLWSRHSVRSAWVLTEADAALRRGILVPVLLDNIEPPLGFTRYQYADLRSWNGEDSHPGWQALVRALSRILGIAPPEQIRTTDPGLKRETVPSRSYNAPKGASDIRIFIAHASDDKPRLKDIIEVLLGVGFRLWIDKPQRIGLVPELEQRILQDRIKYGGDWKEAIRVAIEQARLVLGFWSRTAINQKREQFHYELYQGLIHQKLQQCRIDDVSYEEIGTPYTFAQIADLSDFRPGAFHPELDILIQDMAS